MTLLTSFVHNFYGVLYDQAQIFIHVTQYELHKVNNSVENIHVLSFGLVEIRAALDKEV